ncbi:Hpt domain-containing protein [Pseudodesulfovibrio senegalensis]|nr:Hpt domain-containing protein [Pseudodesulfovibrio senegalensis]
MDKIIEIIDGDLAPIIPRFMDNSKRELEAMLQALEAGEYETLSRLGHNTKGAGFGYGFMGMGEIGRTIEQSAKENDEQACRTAADELRHYLECVEVQYQK